MKTNSNAAALPRHPRTFTTLCQPVVRRPRLWTGLLVFAAIALAAWPAQTALTEAWRQRYGSEAGSEDSAYQVVTDAAGNVIVAGSAGITKYSATGVPLWTNRSVGAMAVDRSGNVFVTGGGTTIAYSGANVPLWTNRFTGSAIGAAVDTSGNVFVTGTSAGTLANSDYLTIAYSGSGMPLWTNRYNGPGNGEDQASGIAVDASGNVFVTGRSTGSRGGSFPSDYATIAYSGAGVSLWTNRYNGPANSEDGATAVAVDGSGNVLVTGYSGHWDGFDWINDYTTIKYSGAGAPLWTKRYQPGNGPNLAVALAVDARDNVFVTGRYYPFGSGGVADSATIAYSSAGVRLWTKLRSGTASAVAVDASGNVLVAGDLTIKYSGAGVPLWTNRYNVSAQGVAVDASGNVFVAGHSVGSGGDTDYAVVAYSGAGVPLWTDSYGGRTAASDIANAVAVDAAGNLFVTGYSYGAERYEDYATVAYSGAGLPLWTNRYNGPANGSDIALAMAVDGSGNVFVTGSSTGSGGESETATIAYSGAGVPLWTNRCSGSPISAAVGAGGNVFVTGYSGTIAYSGAGMPLWTNIYDGAATGVAVDASGNVIVTGSSPAYPFKYDCVTMAYSGAGVPLWTNRHDGQASGSAVAVDASGTVFVTGTSLGSGGNYDFATVAYSRAGMPLWTNRYDGPENGDDIAKALALDANGNVFVTGSSASVGFTGDSDYVTIAYSGAGVPLWTNRFNGPWNWEDQPTAIAVDTSGNVVVTGNSTGEGGSYDYATIAYSGVGLPLRTNRLHGPVYIPGGAYSKSSLAVGPDGAVYVAGASADALVSSDFTLVKFVWQAELALHPGSSQVELTVSAAPKSTWVIERAPEPNGPWTNLGALTIGANGLATFEDTQRPAPAGFYRARRIVAFQ